MKSLIQPGSVAVLLLAICTTFTHGVDFEAPPIDYNHAPTNDPISKLQAKINSGEVMLKFDPDHGYLPDLMKHLKVPISSQMLVFSKTSFQLRRINPKRPRAVYFSDDMYLGWVQYGSDVEISSVDPNLGTLFYKLKQDPKEKPVFERDRGQCLICHASYRTKNVPGQLVRSVFSTSEGRLVSGTSTYTTTQNSVFDERWGGWYVSGTHGDMRHMGNATLDSRADERDFDRDKGANITDLSTLIDIKPYLGKHSDIVALMVMEHQGMMHNLIARANFETRMALNTQASLNKLEGKPESELRPSTRRRIQYVGEQMLRYMLFADEPRMSSPVKGTSGFTEEFQALGPHDRQGRSLRDLDLTNGWLFKHQCSYLIYSEAFDALPAPMLDYVYQRLWEILNKHTRDDRYTHLSRSNREAILAILLDTKTNLPQYWQQAGETPIAD